MKKILFAGAALALAASVSACGSLTAFNAALVPQLRPVDAKIHTDVTCGDMAAQVLGVTAGNNQLTAPQAVAIVQFCERRDATQTLTLDPQGARKVLDGIVNKPAGLSAGALVAPVAAVAAP